MSTPPDVDRPEAATPPKPRALVVEEHEINRKVALRLLDQLGRAGAAAGDGPSALRSLEGARFDLILIALDLSGEDGLALCREIRRREADLGLPRVPILAVLADPADRDRSETTEAGFDGQVARPISRRSLGEALEASGRDRRPLDREALVDRCGGDAHFMAELLGSFSESVTYTLGILRDTLGSGDLGRAAEAAHGLKGCSKTVAAGPLAESSGRLERAARLGDLAGSRAALARAEADWSELLPALGIPREATP